MKRVEIGDFVTLCYKGKLQEDDAFDPGLTCQRLDIQVGSGEILKGFEDAILGMHSNEKKTFTLGVDEAYGQRHDQLVRTFERSDLPPDFDAKPGEMIALQTSEGERILAMVQDAFGDKVTLDMNHPLAGKSLTFEVHVEDIRDKEA